MNKLQWQLLQLLVTGVGILIFFITISRINPSNLNRKMTVGCAHKNNHASAGFADRDVLPTNVRPINYDLTIVPDLTSFTFEGRIAIK